MAQPWEMEWGGSQEPWNMAWDAPKQPTAASDRFVQGLRDPVDAGAQMLTKALPKGVVGAVNKATEYVNNLPVIGPVTKALGMTPATPEQIDQGISQREANYQAPEGVDWARIGGNMASTLPAAMAAPVGTGLAAKTGIGAATGGVFGAFNPVTQNQDNFAEEKLKQIGSGTVAGGLLAPVAAGVSRVINPNVSPELKMLMDNGVTPTIGQRLGGIFKSIEDKATSIPIVGDAITAARNNAREQYNTGAINQALKPIGEKVSGAGNEPIKQAGDLIGSVYEKAKNMVGGFKIDNQANNEISNLISMTRNLTPKMVKKFDDTYTNIFESRLSPNGSILADSFKKVDSELGKDAARWSGSSSASESELGDALKELQRILNDNAHRANPAAQELKQKADAAYARLVRIESAANSAKNSGGVFTPAQLMQGVKQSDKSVRDRATARGTALMQDYAGAGNSVLGNVYPDSGTAGRMWMNAMALGSGAMNPMIPLALGGASIPYLPGARNVTNALLTNRPGFAAPVAKAVEKLPVGLLGPAAYEFATQ